MNRDDIAGSRRLPVLVCKATDPKRGRAYVVVSGLRRPWRVH